MIPLLVRAARLLDGKPAEPHHDDAPVLELLRDLDYLPGAALPTSAQSVAHRSRLLRAAASLGRLFRLPTRLTPNLFFLGGEANASIFGNRFAALPSGSVSGSGTSLREAFESCVGEAVEFLSQFEQPGDLVEIPAGAEVVEPFPSTSPRWRRPDGAGFVSGTRLADGAPIFLPAVRCLRPLSASPESSIPMALGTGCGAGEAFDSAALHGLLELVERDAAALWWEGGRRARPLAMDDADVVDALALLPRLRGGIEERGSWLLDITSDLGVPCVAAVSADRDGRGVACGTACRTTVAGAMRAAIREMCQMELAIDVVEAKLRSRGENALNATDRRHLLRARNLDAETCAQLHPSGCPTRATPVATNEDPPRAILDALVRHVEGHGVQVLAIDLTRTYFEIPVVRVVTPELQPYPCQLATQRLRKVRSTTGQPVPAVPIM